MDLAKTIYIASDHAGYSLKQALQILRPELSWIDLGPENEDRVDYPDYADRVARQLYQKTKTAIGLLICGSGQGMAMRANKYSHIRAALCWDPATAALAREHNDANVLCMGGRLLEPEFAAKILDSFLSSHFQGGRHKQRVDKVGDPTDL
jgi:ribose 5-phosphate isomerase B